jgi:hypothetical protein
MQPLGAAAAVVQVAGINKVMVIHQGSQGQQGSWPERYPEQSTEAFSQGSILLPPHIFNAVLSNRQFSQAWKYIQVISIL